MSSSAKFAQGASVTAYKVRHSSALFSFRDVWREGICYVVVSEQLVEFSSSERLSCGHPFRQSFSPTFGVQTFRVPQQFTAVIRSVAELLQSNAHG